MLQLMFSSVGFAIFTVAQISFIAIISLLKNKKLLSFFLFFSITMIGLYIGIANRWGYDSIHYYIPFYEGDESRKFEPGFTLIVYIMRFIGIPAEIFPIVTVLIATWISFYAVFKLSENYVDTAIIALCLTSMISFMYLYMGGMRQAISFSFVLLSIYYQSRKSSIKCFASILFAVSLHFSALIYIFIFIWQKINIKNKYAIVTISLIFALTSEYIVSSLLKLLPPGSTFTDKIIRAFEYSDRNDEHATYIYKFILTSLFVFIPAFITGNKKKKSNLAFEYMLLTYVFTAILFFSKESSIRYLFVVNILLAVFYVLHIGDMIVKTQKKIYLIIVVMIFFFYGFLSHNWLSELTTRFI